MKKMRLTKEEKALEASVDDYKPVSRVEYRKIAAAISARRKDAVLNIRINREDLESIKKKASEMGVKYQTFIAEILHQIAHQ